MRKHDEIAERLSDAVRLAQVRFGLASAARQTSGPPGEEYVKARLALVVALHRLNHFLVYDVVPNDLKGG